MSIIKSCTALPPTSTIFHGYRLFVFKPTEYITCILFQICSCKKAAPTRTAFLRFWHMPPFPYPFYLTRSLPEKLVISMFKQEFQWIRASLSPPIYYLICAIAFSMILCRFIKYRAPSVRSSPESARPTASTVSAVTLHLLMEPLDTGENWCFW